VTAVLPRSAGLDARAAGMAASAWLRPLLEGPRRTLRIVGTGRHAAYADVGERTVLAIEGPGAARLPNAVRLAGTPRLVVGARGTIGGRAVRVDQLHVRLGRWWDPRPLVPEPGLRVDRLHRARRALPGPDRDHLARHGLAGAVASLATAAVARDPGRLDAVVEALIGRGPGSTPSGDDIVAGLLATLAVLAPDDGPTTAWATALADRAVRRAARTTRLSATLLRCARDGAVAAAASRVLTLLVAPAGAGSALPQATADLARLGHTSGRDLLAGIAIGVDALIADRSQA
jgi:hypothetical protein